MSTIREKILASIRTEEETIQDASDRLTRMIRKLYKDYAARVKATVDAETKLTGEALRQFERVLNDAGLQDVLSAYVEEYRNITPATLRYFRKIKAPVELIGVDIDNLAAVAKVQEFNLSQEFQRKLVAPIQQHVLRTALLMPDAKAAAADIARVADGLTSGQVETLVADSYYQYQRAVIVVGAERAGLDKWFLYIGPDDKITSPQCRALLNVKQYGVPGLLQKKDISAALHPDLRGNPLIAGGHPNCRHQYRAVSDEMVKEMQDG